MKQRYKDKVAYWYPKKQRVKDATISYADTDTHEESGVPFYCNVVELTRRVEVPMSNTYRTVTESLIKTDAQLDFTEHDRITFQRNPNNDVNSQDFSLIVSAVSKPRLQKGSKYRTNDPVTWELRVS